MLVVGLCVFFFSILKSVVYIRPCITFSRLSFETGIFCITFEMCFFVSVCESKKKSFDYDKHLLRKGIDRGKNLRVIEVERRIARGRVWKKLHLQTEQKRKEYGSVTCTYELTHILYLWITWFSPVAYLLHTIRPERQREGLLVLTKWQKTRTIMLALKPICECERIKFQRKCILPLHSDWTIASSWSAPISIFQTKRHFQVAFNFHTAGDSHFSNHRYWPC